MIRLIIGLGNPGLKYRHTPHNVGFAVTDLLADRHGADFRASRKDRALLAAAQIAGRDVILMQPTTYMNLSGEAVAPFARYHGIEPAQLLVVCDDIALKVGRLRIRARGSAGGHKGLLSIIHHLGTNEFPRLRIGIDAGQPIDDLTEYVLRPFWGETREAVERVCEGAADAVERAVAEGLTAKLLSEFNGRDFLS
ncbi:MAG: aminoacyl-tRNA hydrolase [Candidatus Sumerlaeia bacterium]|nr:aminoacyl-tRNA hydrolase [Candidatus Sumerlaeia bacterium]